MQSEEYLQNVTHHRFLIIIYLNKVIKLGPFDLLLGVNNVVLNDFSVYAIVKDFEEKFLHGHQHKPISDSRNYDFTGILLCALADENLLVPIERIGPGKTLCVNSLQMIGEMEFKLLNRHPINPNCALVSYLAKKQGFQRINVKACLENLGAGCHLTTSPLAVDW